jgi:hypothetical protein
MAPPYCGTPRLSHQFPFTADVVEVWLVGGAAVVEVVVVVLVGVVEELTVLVVVEVVEVVQEGRTKEVSKRPVSTVQKTCFFIWPPFFSKKSYEH